MLTLSLYSNILSCRFLHLSARDHFIQLQLYTTAVHRGINWLFDGQFSQRANVRDKKMKCERSILIPPKSKLEKCTLHFFIGWGQTTFFAMGFWCMAYCRPQQKDSKSYNLLLSIVCMTFTLTASGLSVIIQGCTFNDRMRDFAYWVSRSPWKCSEITVIYSYWQGKVC